MNAASRLAVHVIAWSKTLPDPDHFKHSVIISVIIHGSALAILNIATYGLWVLIALSGNVAYQFLFKLASWPVSAGMVLPALQKFPITIGFILISMAHGSCGGLAIICAAVMYFILLSKMYEDYLEEFVFKTASIIAEKLFGKKTNPASAQSLANETLNPAIIASNSESDDKKPIPPGSKKEKCDDTENVEKSTATVKRSELNMPENDESALVVSDTENSFEELYNQLDPSDVALFTEESDDVEDEETKKEIEIKEAGNREYNIRSIQLEDEFKSSNNNFIMLNFSNTEIDAQLEQLIQQMKERQQIEDTKQEEERLAARVEYDDVPDGLSAIHFHMTIFLLLCVLALLNLPSVLVWARNYKYGEKILRHDPSYFPAVASILSLSIIWQLPTPRNV